MVNKLEEIIDKWETDIEFRVEYQKNPQQALERAGFKLSPADLVLIQSKLKIKNEELEKRISK